jgi:hypothetical protein
MGTRRAWLVLSVLFLTTVAHADDHWSEVMGAVSYAHLSDLKGYHFSAAIAVDHVTKDASDEFKKAARHWMVIVDFSGHVWGKHDGVDLNQYTFGLGARRTLVKLAYKTYVPFVQGTIGGAFSEGSTLDGHRGAVTFGGGIDFVGKRTKGQSIGHALRFQGDLVFPWSGEVNWYPRLSAGVVIRIKET